MLALTRKVGESIIIGDDVEITVLAVHGDQIKIGIDAPRSVAIHRKEVYLQIQEENQAASATSEAGALAFKDFIKKKS